MGISFKIKNEVILAIHHSFFRQLFRKKYKTVNRNKTRKTYKLLNIKNFYKKFPETSKWIVWTWRAEMSSLSSYLFVKFRIYTQISQMAFVSYNKGDISSKCPFPRPKTPRKLHGLLASITLGVFIRRRCRKKLLTIVTDRKIWRKSGFLSPTSQRQPAAANRSRKKIYPARDLPNKRLSKRPLDHETR